MNVSPLKSVAVTGISKTPFGAPCDASDVSVPEIIPVTGSKLRPDGRSLGSTVSVISSVESGSPKNGVRSSGVTLALSAPD